MRRPTAGFRIPFGISNHMCQVLQLSLFLSFLGLDVMFPFCNPCLQRWSGSPFNQTTVCASTSVETLISPFDCVALTTSPHGLPSTKLWPRILYMTSSQYPVSASLGSRPGRVRAGQLPRASSARVNRLPQPPIKLPWSAHRPTLWLNPRLQWLERRFISYRMR